MSKKDEALKLALEWLEYIDQQDNDRDFLGPEECCALDDTRNTIREALAERCVCGEPDTPGTHRTDGPCLAEQPAQQQEPVAWCPDVCPITGLPFFMWIEHHETGQMVPTYGGPYDSYTIPVRDKDGSYCRERYDHDRGGWLTDEVEDVGVQIVSDQAYVSDEPPASKPWVGLTTADLDEIDAPIRERGSATIAEIYRAIEAKLREKNAQPSKPLTDEQINAFFQGMEPNNGFWLSFARAIEAAHGITGEQK